MTATRLDDSEIRDLALKLHRGEIFTDRHLRSGNELGMVFMVLAFSTPDDLTKMLEKYGEGLMVYEEMAKAGPRSVNGLPCFFSAQLLHEDDAEKVLTKAREFREAEASV